MYDILTIGGIKMDTFILIPEATVNCQLKMPECQLCIDYGKKIPVPDIDVQVAGSAPNVAIGIAKMKKTSAVYSQMGKDIFHPIAIEFLQKNNVETKYVKALAGSDSGFAAVLNFKGESTQLVKQNGKAYHLPKRLPKTKWIHVSELGHGYEKLYKELIAAKKEKRFQISFNPGAVQINERKKDLFRLIKITDVLFLNRAEAETLTDVIEKTEIHRLMSELFKLGPKYIVVTDGKNGAYAYNGEQLDFAPMFPGARVEATGAGDAFTTGFLGAIMHEKKHDCGLRWGSVNAASVVHSIGPTKGLLSHHQIKKRLREHPNYKTKEL
jgi:sugar/nucleoside kinase (ribokinase family)